MAPTPIITTPGAPLYQQWSNNTASQWWRDKGLRLCMANVLIIFLCAYSQGYDGILLNGLQNLPNWIEEFHPDETTLGLIAASYGFPSIVLPFLAQKLADAYGRRLMIIVGCLLGIAGPLISGFGTSLGTFIAGRVVTGCSTSFMNVSAPSLIAEVSHPRFRAVVTASFQCTFFLGAAVAGWVTFGVTSWDSRWSWRTAVLVQAVGCIPVLVWAMTPLMVESPRWLVSKGRIEEAHQLLAKLHANGDLEDELVVNELDEIKAAFSYERSIARSSYADFFTTTGNRKRLAVIALFGFITQMSGNGIAASYLGKMLAMVGITEPLPVNGIISGLSLYLLVVAVIMCQFVERVGRRGQILGGLTGMIIFLSMLIAFTAVAEKSAAYGRATIAMIFLFMTFYSCSLTSLPFLYLTEILPYSLRTKGLALLVFFQAIWQVYTQYVTPVALGAISWKYYFVCLASDLGAIAAAFYLIRETKGRTLEEIVELFDGPHAAVTVDSAFDDEKGMEVRKE